MRQLKTETTKSLKVCCFVFISKLYW